MTKIKGWREKFSTASSSSVPGVTTSSDTGQKNLSAFCSDMLDEYLESEGKLIDERAASFSQATVSPVAYQLPTKSTSYVRTLDSVLKKQAIPLAASLSKPSTSKKTTVTSKSKETVSGVKMKKSIRSGIKNPVSSTGKKSDGNSLNKSMKSKTAKSISEVLSASPDLSQSKKSPKIKTKKGSRTSQHSLQTAEKPVKDSVSVAPERQNTSCTPGSNPPLGRSSGLPKTLVKLRDVEDGAVWEGRHRTYITMERAAIALSCLVTAEGIIGGSPSTVIKRRAPPCLKDFCRLGCVCASLIQERRQNHCGKPQCMLRCDCLRRKVVLLKNEDTDLFSEPQNHEEENGAKVKKKKNRISYILSGPDAAPEPALCVKTLWVRKNDSNSEQLYVPDPARPLQSKPVSLDLRKDSENLLHPSPKKTAVRAVDEEGLSMVKNQESLDCARVRPFCGRTQPTCRQRHTKEGHQEDLSSQDSLQEMEEGELRPPTQSGPTKRLEIVSKCKWATEGSRNVVLRTVCERMAQDRLEHPFWIGKYQIQPTSKTVKETDEGSITTYKVVISQPHLEDSEEKKEERIKQLEAELMKTIGKSEVKGLPLLSQVTPAGLLKAEKKPSGALGQIMVNGKLYPQAKLELGQMGALHPANRLAAYITGRVSVANKQETNVVTKTCTAPTTSTSVATATVTSTLSSTVTLDKPPVPKHPMGAEFVQDEISCVNSQQQKTDITSKLQGQNTVKNLIIPSSPVLTGSTVISVSPNIPPKARIASLASPASVSTDGSIQVVKALPGSGSAAPEKTFLVSTSGSNVTLSGSGIRLLQPLTPTRPAVPGQKMVMVKTANSTGNVIHLVPISQFRALNPNVVINPQQPTLIRLPVPLSKLQVSTAVASNTVLASATQDQNMAPEHSTITNTVMTNSTSLAAPKRVISLSGSKTLLVCNKPRTVKIIPGFRTDTVTSTLRFLPQRVLEEPKIAIDPRITSAAAAQSFSEGQPANQGLQITSQSCLTSKVQEPQISDNPIHSSSTPTEESCEEDFQCCKISPKNVIFTDHSYTTEVKNSTPPKKTVDVSNDSSDPASGSTYHMLLKEVLNLGLAEGTVGCDSSDAVAGTESGDGSKAGSHLMEEEDESECTELTEDSDMYNDTDSSPFSDEENLCDSDGVERNKEKQDTVAKVKVLIEKEDDELIDIETFEEGAEKSPVRPKKMEHDRSFKNQSSDEESENENLLKLRRRKDEKQRRITLKNCFCNLQQTLHITDPKVPRITVLSEALAEIHSLSKRREHLVKMRDKLRRKRDYYIEMASQLSGNNKASICQKLDEVTAKAKSQEIKGKANDSSPTHKKSVPKHSKSHVITKPKKMSTSGRTEHLSISEQKNVGFPDRRREIVSTNQKTKPSQPPNPPNSHPTPQLRKRPSPIPGASERIRPNILTRKSQSLAKEQVLVPEVISTVEAVVPYSQVITISNPLQPIDNTSLGERQSATPELDLMEDGSGIDSLHESDSISSYDSAEEEAFIKEEDIILDRSESDSGEEQAPSAQAKECHFTLPTPTGSEARKQGRGVAAVSIYIPPISHPLCVENPLPILQPQVLKLASSPVNKPVENLSLPKISRVVSLEQSEKLLVTSPAVTVLQTQAACNSSAGKTQQDLSSDEAVLVEQEEHLDKQLPEVLPRSPEHPAKGDREDPEKEKEDEKSTPPSEQDDDHLMSLLDELVFLNQTSESQGAAVPSLTEAGDVMTELFTNKEADIDRDDERSLSPLFLKLDEEDITSPSNDEEMDDIPPKVDDLVKVIFGSESPPNSSESDIIAAASDDGTHVSVCHVKHDAPIPPPLLQMKTGGCTTADSPKEQVNLSWRPMPKLAPLGLKTQETGHSKLISPHAPKSDSKPHSLHNTYL